jgi:hypothetical protein
VGLAAFAEAHRPRLRRRSIRVPGLPLGFDGWRVLHISDVHFRSSSRWPERIAALAAEAGPEVVVVTGDLMCCGRKGAEPSRRLLGLLAGRWPTWVVPGNSDRPKGGEFLPELWAGSGASILLDRNERVGRGGSRVVLAGVDDPHDGDPDLESALEGVGEREFVLLLAHSPEVMLCPGSERAHLVFCGHTHGGQIRAPWPIPALWTHSRLGRRFAEGAHRFGPATLIISRGAGTARVPLRLFCSPEVTLWTLRAGPAR